jgi:hypothetical protein
MGLGSRRRTIARLVLSPATYLAVELLHPLSSISRHAVRCNAYSKFVSHGGIDASSRSNGVWLTLASPLTGLFKSAET